MSSATNSTGPSAGVRDDFHALRQEIAKLVVGQQELIDGVLTALVAGGHVLVEGPPGVGKTVAAEALGAVLGMPLQRIQFTPDLMPADIIGTYVVMENAQGRRTFEFQQGPIFANLVLADHINRGTPKTQSALLEAMEGATVSVATEKFRLPQPHFVLATQNPQDSEGTFPLPEPELDRFLLELLVAGPTDAELEQILERTTEAVLPALRPVVDGPRILQMRQAARQVLLPPELRRYAVAVTAATHPDHTRAPATVQRYVRYGSGPRGAQAMVAGAKVRAAADGRSEVSQADLHAVAHAALRHRLALNYEAQAEDVRPDALIDEILDRCAD